MGQINRRDFTGTTLAALGTTLLPGSASSGQPAQATLPTVRWGKHEISRVLVGHNPLKGQSHFSAELNREMRQWFAEDPSRGLALLRRCEQCGVNTCQMGAPSMEALLRTYRAEGGRLQWISTFYSKPGQGKKELDRILSMDPRPIGIQQLGNTSDWLMREGKIDDALENLKRFRDAGVLVGLGSHNHEVIDYAESKGWDLDFYQCCFYRSWFGVNRTQNTRGEVFEEPDRQSMVNTIRQVSKPCIAFKVLGANRNCATAEDVRAALEFAYANIKATDVVLAGMWQKYHDQVAQNAEWVREIIGA